MENKQNLNDVVKRYINGYINSMYSITSDDNELVTRQNAIKQTCQNIENYMENIMINTVPNFRDSDQSYFHIIIQLRNNIEGCKIHYKGDEYDKRYNECFKATIGVIGAVSQSATNIIIKHFGILSDLLEQL
jgi:hypothetical protein